jgi:hypothetical protein
MASHGDGRGSCEVAESQLVAYGGAAVVVLVLVGAVVYVVGYESYYKKNLGAILNRGRGKGGLPT